MKPNLRTRFPDLPGWYANPVTGGWVIYDKEELSNSVGFYDAMGFLVLSIKGRGYNRVTHKCDGGIHQAMRMAFLLMQEQKAYVEPQAPEVTYENRIMRFRDMPGLLVHPYRVVMSSGNRSIGGFNIYDDDGNHVGHYMRQSKNLWHLWLHPTDVVTAVEPFPNLMQAVRYVFLNTQKETAPSE